VTAELTAPGNVLFLLGDTAPEFAGSHLDLVLGGPATAGAAPQPDAGAPARYRRLHAAIRDDLVRACHDVSEGGLAVALAELCIAGRLGATVDALPHHDTATALFAESIGRLVVEVAPADVEGFLATVGTATRLGTVAADPVLRLPGVAPLAVAELAAAFLGGDA
jgi:phosphoribosylformylglycinamidine synthase